MAIIRNSHSSNLGLPMGGPELRAGSETRVERWGQIKDHPVVKMWLVAGVLDEVEAATQAEPKAEPAPVKKAASPKKAPSAN